MYYVPKVSKTLGINNIGELAISNYTCKCLITTDVAVIQDAMRDYSRGIAKLQGAMKDGQEVTQ